MTEPSYWPEMADRIDREVDLIAERLGVDPLLAHRIWEYKEEAVQEQARGEVARILSMVLSEFVRPCKNLRARVYGLIFAAGLDQANAIHSQAEVARKLGCTRALISHYTTEWADKFRLGVFKFRKAERSRAVFQKAQEQAWEKRKSR